MVLPYRIINTGLLILSAFLITMLCYWGTALSQVNTEKMRVEKDDNGFTGRINISLKYRSGNVDLIDTGSGLRLQFKKNKHTSFVVNNIQFAENKSLKLINKGFSHIRYNYAISKDIRWEIFNQYEFNEFTRLFNRRLLGTGIRKNMISDTNINLVLGSSFMFEYEHLDLPGNSVHKRKSNDIRWSNYFITNWSNKNAALVNSVYFQPVVNSFDDYRILDEFELQTVIKGDFSLSLSISLRYDSKPPDNVKSTDLGIFNGLTYSF